MALAVLLACQYFKPKPAQPLRRKRRHSSRRSRSRQPAAPGQPASGCRNRCRSSYRWRSTPTAIAAATETETTVENELYKIVFTNRGAQVKHWILKKYIDTSGKPLDLVQPQLAARFGLPLSFFTYEPALTTQLNQALYQVTVSGRAVLGYRHGCWRPARSPSATRRTASTW